MATSKKQTEPVTEEAAPVEENPTVLEVQPAQEDIKTVNEPEPIPEPKVVDIPQGAPPIYIPEIPAQVEEAPATYETETSFLTRLMDFQNTGGWGRHLNPMIIERLKLLNGK